MQFWWILRDWAEKNNRFCVKPNLLWCDSKTKEVDKDYFPLYRCSLFPINMNPN